MGAAHSRRDVDDVLEDEDMTLVFEMLTLGAIIATYSLVVWRWKSIQGRVPRHFNLLGRPDGWSSGWILWFYPSLALVFAVGMTLAVVIEPTLRSDPEIAEGVAAACALMAVLMLVVTERSIAVARKRANGLGWMFLPCLAIAIALLVWHYS
jgi:hypothetical protein